MKGRLVKACMCSMHVQQGADPADAEGAVEVTTGGDQQQKADGAAAEASHQQATHQAGITPPGSTAKLMYTPVASQRRHEVQQMEEGGDATRKMVVVIPKGVKLKVSSAEDLYCEEGTKPVWMEAEMDLRKDIILMCHDMA